MVTDQKKFCFGTVQMVQMDPIDDNLKQCQTENYFKNIKNPLKDDK
jgi:hypothetical protein